MHFLGLDITKYRTDLHGIRVMLVSGERSCFIKHTVIFTIHGLFIKKTHYSKQKKKKKFSATSITQIRKTNLPEK